MKRGRPGQQYLFLETQMFLFRERLREMTGLDNQPEDYLVAAMKAYRDNAPTTSPTGRADRSPAFAPPCVCAALLGA